MQPGEFQRALDAGNLRSAGAWLVQNCAADVLSLCTAMVRDRAMAEDLAQDAFGKALSNLGSFRGEASPRTWLMAIARNRCLDHLRRQRHSWLVTPDSDASDNAASDAPLPADLLGNRNDVARALASLDETQRALIVLRFRHGLSYHELGSAFGIKTGAVRMRVSRALGRMRETLQNAHRHGEQAAAARPRAAMAMPAMSPPPPPTSAQPPGRPPAQRSAPPPRRSTPPPAYRPPAHRSPGGPPPAAPLRPPALGAQARDVPGAGPSFDHFAAALEVAIAPVPASLQSSLSALIAAL